MTLGLFKQIMEENHIPDDTVLHSNSGWECGETDMDGIYYSKLDEEIVFTQCGDCSDEEFSDNEYELLHGYNKLCRNCANRFNGVYCCALKRKGLIPEYIGTTNTNECHKFVEKVKEPV